MSAIWIDEAPAATSTTAGASVKIERETHKLEKLKAES